MENFTTASELLFQYVMSLLLWAQLTMMTVLPVRVQSICFAKQVPIPTQQETVLPILWTLDYFHITGSKAVAAQLIGATAQILTGVVM